MRRYLGLFVAIIAFVCTTNGQSQINVKLIYREPIEGYVVTADWQPFEPTECETGHITITFRDTTSGKEFQYVNHDKFSSYHTDLITSADGFAGYKDGDVYTIEYETQNNPFEESPLDFYLPFQFFDIDFDEEKELLINDYYRGQQGNNYEVYEITNSGLEAKTYPPFDSIDNRTEFDSEKRIITLYSHSGVKYACWVKYQKSASATKQTICVPDEFDDELKQELAKFASDAPSDFQIITATVILVNDRYELKVESGT